MSQPIVMLKSGNRAWIIGLPEEPDSQRARDNLERAEPDIILEVSPGMSAYDLQTMHCLREMIETPHVPVRQSRRGVSIWSCILCGARRNRVVPS